MFIRIGFERPDVRIRRHAHYVWKKRHANLWVRDMRELRHLREENGRLQRLVADLKLDRPVLQEVARKEI